MKAFSPVRSIPLVSMADDLVERCSQLALTSTEEDIIDFGGDTDEAVDEKLDLRLVGRVLTTKPLNFDVVRRTLTHIWSLKEGVVIRALGSNLFLFQFFHWRDRDKVLAGRPWNFENRLIVIQELDKEQQPSEMALNHSPFWVRLYNIPFGYKSDDRVKTMAKAIGEVIEIEEDYLDNNPYRRIRVLIDVTKPLKRFQLIKLKSQTTVKINLKYERLPHFCFLCGLLCHSEKDCSIVSEEVKDKGYGWGLNIKASPRKGLSKNNEEVQALKSRKCLFVTKPKAVVGRCVEADTSKHMEAGALKNVDNAALENKSDDALISEDNILLVHVENNGGGELAATGTSF